MFRDLGVPVLDSDAEVHRLYAPGGAAVAPIAAAFGPGVLTPEGGVDRSALGPLVAGGGAAARERLAALEGLVHPLVAAARSAFVARHAASPLVVLDVPLLYETGGQAGCDAVAVVSCGGEGVARARVLARPGASAERLDALLARQLPDAEKRARADFVVDTGCALEQTRGAVERLARSLATTAERREGAGGAEGGT